MFSKTCSHVKVYFDSVQKFNHKSRSGPIHLLNITTTPVSKTRDSENVLNSPISLIFRSFRFEYCLKALYANEKNLYYSSELYLMITFALIMSPYRRKKSTSLRISPGSFSPTSHNEICSLPFASS